ncbi:MAG: TonB-dependent receptor, partial [Pseudomonadota bacterium]|nr:TonB-dependent receptor [Pseudomonadota bacterium]
DGFKPDAYALLDLYGKWQFMDNAALNVGIQNVFDTRYFTADAIGRDVTVSDSVANGNPIELMTGAGRTFQVSLNLEF